jgi:flagellar hook assembly protein FlgD
MRKSAVLVALALVAALGTWGAASPAPASAATGPKVVIIVGATHGATDRYRDYADQEYLEARKYTANVVRVYSPNATWSRVKSAVAGASIVIYHGHGNGWPSPYAYDPSYTTQDGFGQNAVAGQGDHNNKYYGEPYIDDLRFAPNAVVLLHNLCYAAGNSEPGRAAPTTSVARQRADNYASAFLKAGAAAVIAGGHEGAGYYIGALFATRQTLDELWRGAPSFNDNVFSFASARRPGKTVQMDPDEPGKGFYRSIAGDLDTRTEDITGAAFAATDGDPASLVTPGAASTGSAGAQLFEDPEMTVPGSLLAADVPLRVTARVGTSTVFAVETLDGAEAGYVAGTSLLPRDSRGPTLWDVDEGTGAFSPNADGSSDRYVLDARFSEEVDWRVRFSDGEDVLEEVTGTGDELTTSWDGIVSGSPVADGEYGWTIEAWDEWGNTPLVETGSLTVDTVAPAIEGVTLAATSPAAVFSPNGDARSDALAFTATTSEPGSVVASIENSLDLAVMTLTAPSPAGSGRITWDGRNSGGNLVVDGLFDIDIAARDRAGNLGTAITRTVGVYGAIASVATSTALFWPHDGDRRAPYATLSFRLLRQATVTWDVRALDGTVVYTRYGSVSLAAGTYSFRWNGRNQGGALVPPGHYVSYVRGTTPSGTVSLAQAARVQLNAFALGSSDVTPARRQRVTITATSAEYLRAAPRVRIEQPGIAAWAATMTKVSPLGYRVTITLKPSSAGTLRLRVGGYDLDGHYQSTGLTLPLG